MQTEALRVVAGLALHLVDEPAHDTDVGPNGQRRILEDLCGQRFGGGNQLRARHHAVHHAVLVRLLGREHAAGQRDLVRESAARPEPGGDPVLAAGETALHLADLELRARGRHDQVARLRQ